MAQSKQQIQSLLDTAGTSPRHRFGQNFMIDQNLVRIVADAGNIQTGDTVIEVGPGTGTLTEELMSRGANLIAVEIDRDLAKLLRERFADRSSFRLIEGDALSSKHALNEELETAIAAPQRVNGNLKLVANLPYNIASPLIIECLIAGVDLLAFTVQKEVALRLKAGANSDAYGPLSVMAQSLAQVEILRTLPPQAFWPAPKIESSLVRMTRAQKIEGDVGKFSRFVQTLFSFRRKTLRKAWSMAEFAPIAQLEAVGQQRIEEFSPEQIYQMYRSMPDVT